MPWYTYFVGLVLISAFVALLEHWRPARPEQQALRPWLWSDLLHLIVNGHLLGVVLYGLARRFVLPTMDGWLTDHGWFELVYRNAASDWPCCSSHLHATDSQLSARSCPTNGFHMLSLSDSHTISRNYNN